MDEILIKILLFLFIIINIILKNEIFIFFLNILLNYFILYFNIIINNIKNTF